MIGAHLKEFLITLVLIIALAFLIELVPEPETLSAEFVFSPVVLLLGIIALSLPFFASIPAGYLISKKRAELKDAIAVPAAAGVVAALLIVGFSVVQLMLTSDAEIAEQLQKMEEFGMGFFASMTPEQYRSFAITSSLFGFVLVAVINFALGILGGLAGRFIALRRI